MIGEEIKIILILFISLACFFFCFQNVSAQAEPPSIEDARSFWKGIKDDMISFLGIFKFVEKGIEHLSPFFENTGNKIGSWWSFGAKPWLEYHWTNFNIYLNQEIKLE